MSEQPELEPMDEAAIEAAAAQLAEEEAALATVVEATAAVADAEAASSEVPESEPAGDERLLEPSETELALAARVRVLEASAAAEVEERTARRLVKLSTAELPVSELSDAMLHLRRPFSSAAIRWKLQTVYKNFKGGIVVGYIDARLVIERLNAVWPWWEDRYEPAGNGAVRCFLSLLSPVGQGAYTRSDVGEGSGPQALKGANSDAFKRAAVKWGVGVSVYAMRAIPLNVGEGANELRTREKMVGKGTDARRVPYPILDAANEERLALGYERWLLAKGAGLFGPVLDHGDELGAGGVEEMAPATVGEERLEAEIAAVDAEAGDSPVLSDERAKLLMGELEEAFKVVRARAPRKLAPAAFRAKFNQASRSSHEALEELLATVRAIGEAS